MSKYRADQLVFLDESGFNTLLAHRRKAWGPKGKKIRVQIPKVYAQNLSLLPAMTIDGYIACCMFKGGVTKERFIHFIETDLIPKLSKFPGKNSVIVLDNAKIHHGEVRLSLIYYIMLSVN